MKIFTSIITVMAIGLVVFNFTKLNTTNLFEGESIIALITIFSGLCAIVLLQILRLSKRIEEKSK